MSFVYANPGSGPSAGGIGWFDFGSLTLQPGQVVTGLSGTLSDGSVVSFDATSLPSSIVPLIATPTPLLYSYFGSAGYTGIVGNVAMFTPLLPSYSGPTTLEISNIVVKDVNGNIVTNYTGVVADAESTNKFPQYTEYLKLTTTGTPWNLLTTLGPNPPTLAGVGSNIVTITGTNQSSQAAYVLTSASPTKLTFEIYGREAVVFGFSTTRITLKKRIGARINSSDQFIMDIAGTPNHQVTTTGSATGVQSQVATIYAIPGNTYTINEAMAGGSSSPLSAYSVVPAALNLTPSGTTPPLGTLPINVTPQLGDNIIYTISNAAPEKFTKTVDKEYADKGDILTYTVTIDNPNDVALNNVLMSDPTPAGTTYIGNLLVSAPYSGTSPATGLTITTINPNSSVTISWQVQVNANMQVAQVNNSASISIPGGTSGNTNVVSTKINNADLTTNGNFMKSVTPTNAKPGDILTYTITLKNTGNVPANNVVVKDVVPLGTSFVAGSITSTIPFSATTPTSITLTAPIPPNTTATITFQVKVGNSLPPMNPIPNNASVDYAYTVDPAHPNGTSNSGISNTVTTNIVKASASTSKQADKKISYVGDIITYNIVVKNDGNTPLNNVLISDVLPNGTSYIPGSLNVSAPYSGTPATGITLTNALLPGASVTISFKVTIVSMPSPNPIENVAEVAYTYTLSSINPNGESGTSTSNTTSTLIFRNNYQQQINDLIASVALEQAALAAIADAEGAKVQKALALGDITQQELLCINKSVQEMIDSISSLESILKQKLNIVDCQINGDLIC
ncbi:MAG: hypothetical protein RR986_04030 [Longicatena sp.]